VQTKVLVIDDDIEMTELLKIILEPSQFEVATANSGIEGLRLAREGAPDVIILDLMMDGMDGWQVCREVRKFSNVPIMVLTALSKPGMAARALDAGADDYLLKPMTSGVLVAHLRNLVRRSRAEQDAIQAKLDYQV
jgi:DNA-binding response OmpR family regulator